MKKGILPLERVISFLLILIALLAMLAFFAPEGWLNAVAEPVKDFGTWILPRDDFKEQGDIISAKVNSNFTSLVKTFKKAGDKACLLVYHELEAIDGKWKIRIEKQDGDILFKLMDDQGAELSYDVAKNTELCVVAKGSAADNFYNYYLLGNEPLKKEYTDVTEVEISDVNKLKIDGEEGYDLEDNNLIDSDNRPISLLYNDGNGHVCFMPTNDVRNHNENGLDDNIIWNLYEGASSKLPLCS